MTSALSQSQWVYQYGAPNAEADFKTTADDFVVTEQLGFSPLGQGEHLFLWVEKVGLNTAYVAEQLAKYANKPLRTVTYAGRKDKHAKTFQWFGIHHPGKIDIDWSAFNLPNCTIHSATRHNKKLRVGVLKGNEFAIHLRNVSDVNDACERLNMIKRLGVPNYYGEQRFGNTRHHANGSNLALAQRMIAGEVIRNRNKRSMAISALRSWLFNETVSYRFATGNPLTPLSGDVLMLDGSNSFFTADEIDKEIVSRLRQGDLQITAPLWGEGALHSSGDALTLETKVALSAPDATECLASLGLKQERRPISVTPQNMHWQTEKSSIKLTFSLASGCFATSILREVAKLCYPLENTDENTAE